MSVLDKLLDAVKLNDEYDEDDYLRLGLNYAIYKFKSLIKQ